MWHWQPGPDWQTGATLFRPNCLSCHKARTSIAPRYAAPGVAQYSLGVQREIVPSLILMSQYVGNVAWHQNVELPINTFPLSTSMSARALAGAGKLTSAQTTLARTFPGFNQITEETNIATGTYNSFQTGLRQQSRHGLSFEVDYTWAHEIDSQLGSADLPV